MVKNWLNPEKHNLDLDEQDTLENDFSIFSRYVFYLDKWQSLDGYGLVADCEIIDLRDEP